MSARPAGLHKETCQPAGRRHIARGGNEKGLTKPSGLRRDRRCGRGLPAANLSRSAQHVAPSRAQYGPGPAADIRPSNHSQSGGRRGTRRRNASAAIAARGAAKAGGRTDPACPDFQNTRLLQGRARCGAGGLLRRSRGSVCEPVETRRGIARTSNTWACKADECNRDGRDGHVPVRRHLCIPIPVAIGATPNTTG